MLERLKVEYLAAKALLAEEQQKYQQALTAHIDAGGNDFDYNLRHYPMQDARKKVEQLAMLIAEVVCA